MLLLVLSNIDLENPTESVTDNAKFTLLQKKLGTIVLGLGIGILIPIPLFMQILSDIVIILPFVIPSRFMPVLEFKLQVLFEITHLLDPRMKIPCLLFNILLFSTLPFSTPSN